MVCTEYESDWSDPLSSRKGAAHEARGVAIHLCRRLSGETPARIGAKSRLDNYGNVSSVVSRMKKRPADEVRLRKQIERPEKQLRKAQDQTCPGSWKAV